MIAIDLGSNTCRVIEYNCETKQFICEYEKIVKTADGIEKSSLISEATIERVIEALRSAQDKIDFKNQAIEAYATAALRMATNSKFALDEIYKHTGVQFKIIDGDLEAKLTHMAVKNRLDILNIDNSSFVLVDVGGGSCEVIFSQDEKVHSKSFNVGIVTVTQRATSSSEIPQLIDEALKPIKEYINTFYQNSPKPKTYVSTAGTPTTVASYLSGMTYKTYDSKKINGLSLSREQLLKSLDDLLALSEEDRSTYVGVGREDLIITGILIIEKFYKLLGFNDSIVVDDGLREGIALHYCSSNS